MFKHLMIILACCAVPAAGQEPNVSTEVVSIALDGHVSGLFFNNGKEISVFQASPTGLGEPLSYKGPRRFALRSSEAEFAMKPPLPAPAAWVDLPTGSDRVLLACIKSGEAPLKLAAYDIGKARLRAGQYRVYNFSHSTVSMILGEGKTAIEPGKDVLLSSPSWEKEVMEIDVAAAIVKDGKAKPVYSSQWGNRPGRRNFIFIFDGPRSYQPLKFCRFFDTPPKDTGGNNP
jgi:hypothetical protein